MTRLFILVILFLSPLVLEAHPVIWKGGRALLIQSDSGVTDTRFFYSAQSDFSIGARHLTLHDRHQSYGIVQSNALLKRWNQRASQGNVYAWLGTGLSVDDGREQDGIGVIGAHADWEDRRFYIASHSEFYSLSGDDITKLQARVGVAPYISEFEALHTWIILQFDQTFEGTRRSEAVIPVLRLFQGPVLFEIGSNFDDTTFLALMVHF